MGAVARSLPAQQADDGEGARRPEPPRPISGAPQVALASPYAKSAPGLAVLRSSRPNRTACGALDHTLVSAGTAATLTPR